MNCIIYQIRNRLTGKAYVGSTLHWSRRVALHRCLLKKGKHHSARLQKSFNKHGPTVFEFAVLEKCARQYRSHREKHWIVRLNAYKAGYNCIEDPTTRLLSKKALKARGDKIRRSLSKPGLLEARTKKIAAAHQTVAARKNRSKISSASWQNPARRRRMIAAIRKASKTRVWIVTDETRARMSWSAKHRKTS